MEPQATNEKTPIGLMALLPADKIEGHNILVLSGWEIQAGDDGERKYALHLVDGRSTGGMGANKLLAAIAAFEMAHPDNLFKRADGGYNYKSPVVVEFDYTSKKGGFKTPYTSILVYLKGQPKPSPTKTVGGGRPTTEGKSNTVGVLMEAIEKQGGPTVEQQLEAFV